MKIETLYAIMLPGNFKAISLMRRMGFTITYPQDDTAKGTLSLKEEEPRIECSEPKSVAESKIQAQPAQTDQKQAEAI
jgi:hypothetical protein